MARRATSSASSSTCCSATDATPRSPERVEFAQRLQQLSAPATAKGVEDTALYVYVPLASRNEIGGASRPSARRCRRAIARTRTCCAPNAGRSGSLATNTHDAKRSADVRARLGALTELPQEWERAVQRWRRLNAKHRHTVRGRIAPDTNTEYLLYQMLVALWPAPRPGRRSDDLPDRAWRDSANDDSFGYTLKAAREAKMRTTWIEPTPTMSARSRFRRGHSRAEGRRAVPADVARLVARIAPIGARNALSRIAVHLTSPGTPVTTPTTAPLTTPSGAVLITRSSSTPMTPSPSLRVTRNTR